MTTNNNGKPPRWQEFYHCLMIRAAKDTVFRAELLADPKAVIEKELGKQVEGAKLPANLQVKVIEQSVDTLYVVVPAMSGELTDEALAEITAGVSMPDQFMSGLDMSSLIGCPLNAAIEASAKLAKATTDFIK